MEVYGTNDYKYEGEVDSLPQPEADGTQVLAGGNWKLERATEVDAAANEQADALTLNPTSGTAITLPFPRSGKVSGYGSILRPSTGRRKCTLTATA